RTTRAASGVTRSTRSPADARPSAPATSTLTVRSEYWFGALDGDDDLPLGVSLAHVLEGVGGLAQLVAPLDHRLHLSGLEQLSECHQIRPAQVRHEERGLMAGTPRAEPHPDDVPERTQQAVLLRPAYEHHGRVRLQHALARRPRPAPGVVDAHV